MASSAHETPPPDASIDAEQTDAEQTDAGLPPSSPSAPPPGSPPPEPTAPPLNQELAGGLARSAGLLSMGNAASRVLGLVREMVIAALFGATGEVSAFRVAAQAPIMLYDFLMGGMLSAALVPVLSRYARLRSREEFAYLIGVLAALFALLLTLLVLLLELMAPQVAWLLAAGFRTSDPALLALTTRLIRLTAPAVWLLSMAGLTTAILYALQRFSFPALATAIYNLGIVLAAPLLAGSLGIASLAVGMLIGAGAQVSIMVWDLGRTGLLRDLRANLRFDWHHPALREIFLLYLPIAAGLVVSLAQIGLDRRLASATGAQSIAWMSNATTLQQMPLGLISVAISLAALPSLSRHYAADDLDAYRNTLGRGLRMVLLLIVPAAALLWTLGEPLTRLLFERNRFTAQDTAQVVTALNIYVLGMLFAAVDHPLNFAFYARGNTWLPATVGVVSVAAYVATAPLLMAQWGYLGLVWADTIKQAVHALIMVGFIGWQVGTWRLLLGRGILWILLFGGMAAGAGWLAAVWLAQAAWFASVTGMARDLLLLVLAGGGAMLVYAAGLWWSGVPELTTVWHTLQQRLRRIYSA